MLEILVDYFSMASSTLEEKALERKERLKALKRKRQGEDAETTDKNAEEHLTLPK